jgi:hypothetical protein
MITFMHQKVTPNAIPQAINGALAKGETQRIFFHIKGTPSSPLNFTCMTIVDKSLTILNCLHKKDGLLWKQIGDEE